MRYLFIILIFKVIIFANDTKLLSNTKQEIIQLKQDQIEKKKQTNKYDWLSDITINGALTKDNDDIDSKSYSISISQEIFNFGGINKQMKYADVLKELETLDLQISTKEDLYSLISLLIDIKLNDIKLEQNNLNISNNLIDIRHKKSEYKAGELSISDLNDAIMTKNQLKDTQKELQLAKLVNINEIKKYTDKDYKNIILPEISLLSKEDYIQNSTEAKYAKTNSNVSNLLYEIKKTDYLPKLNANANYGYKNTDTTLGDDYYNYGLQFTLPLSFNSKSYISQKKIDYLISKQELVDTLNNVELSYDETLLNINNYKERTLLAFEDIKLYEELILVNEEEYKAGYKTIDDVDTLTNSKKIRELDIRSFELNIKKLLYKLYFQTF
jgi:outer membrane protein TolC